MLHKHKIYTLRGICSRIVTRSNKGSIAILAAIIYSLLDIYGLRGMPQAANVLYHRLKKEMKQHARTKK